MAYECTYRPDAGDHSELFWSGFGWDDSHPYAHAAAKYTGIMPVLLQSSSWNTLSLLHLWLLYLDASLAEVHSTQIHLLQLFAVIREPLQQEVFCRGQHGHRALLHTERLVSTALGEILLKTLHTLRHNRSKEMLSWACFFFNPG